MGERSTTIRAREIGYQLRRHRERSGLTQYFVGKRVGLSTPSVSRIEDGSKPATSEDAAALLALYGVTGPERDALLAMARGSQERGWWQRETDPGQPLNTLASLEPRACAITSHEDCLVPGLLQIPEYSAALMRVPGTIPAHRIEAKAQARWARRGILFREDPVHLAAFVGEPALRRVYGSAAVLHRQLRYLLSAMERPNIIIRVVPIAALDVLPTESFHLLRFPLAPAVVHVETHTSDLYFEEPHEIDRYDAAVHSLMKSALDTGESAGLITRLMRALEDDPDVLPKFGRTPVAEE